MIELLVVTAPGCFRCIVMKKMLSQNSLEFREIQPQEAPGRCMGLPTLFVMKDNEVQFKVEGLLTTDAIQKIQTLL